MRILIITMLALIGLSACSDIVEPEEVQVDITDDVILTTMRAFLNTQEAANQAMVSNPAILLDNLDLSTIQQLCNNVIDTSLYVEASEQDFDISFTSEVALTLQCNDLGFPTQIFFAESSLGNYSTSSIQGSFDQVSSYQVGLNLIDMEIQVSGITGNSGTLMLNHNEGYQNYTTSLRLDVAVLHLDILSQKILQGNALATLNYSNEEIQKEFIVKIEYLDNATIDLEFNGNSYTLDFGN